MLRYTQQFKIEYFNVVFKYDYSDEINLIFREQMFTVLNLLGDSRRQSICPQLISISPLAIDDDQ